MTTAIRTVGRAAGDQDRRAPGGDDPGRGARARTARHPGARRVGRRRGRVDHRCRLRRRRRRDRADGRRRLGPGDGHQGQGAQGGGVRFPARRPDAVHVPPSGRLPRGRQGAGRRRDDRAGVRDGAARRRRAAVAGADERGRGTPGPAAGRPLPGAPQRRPGRADGRGPRRAAGQGRRPRRRQRGVERGVDRRRHGGRGRPHRQEPRPFALGRPDPPRSDHDAGVEPRAPSSAASPTPTSSSGPCSWPAAGHRSSSARRWSPR